MRRLARNHRAALLDGRVRNRMLGDISSRAHVEHYEHIEEGEPGGDRKKEVTRQDCLRVIPDKRSPSVGRVDHRATAAGAADTGPPCGATRSAPALGEVRPRCAPRPRSGSRGPCVTISRIRSTGIGGRPARVYHQKRRQPWRCHRINVSGLTTVSIERQSSHRDNTTRHARREVGPLRLGTFRRVRRSARTTDIIARQRIHRRPQLQLLQQERTFQ